MHCIERKSDDSVVTVVSGGMNILLAAGNKSANHPSKMGITCGNALMKVLKKRDSPPGIFLDVGTGCGHMAIIAGKYKAKKVIATDIDEKCLWSVRHNWELNNLPHDQLVVIKCGDVNELMDEYVSEIDIIVSNPPQKPKICAKSCWYSSGDDGRLLLDQVLLQTRQLLSKDGILLTVGRTETGWVKTQNMLTEQFGKENWEVIVEMDHENKDPESLQNWYKERSTESDPRIFQKEDGKWYQKAYYLAAVRVEQ